MSSIIDVEKYNRELTNFKGSNAKIWSYDKTLGRFLLRLWNFDKDKQKVTNEVFIAVLSCEYIMGPFTWNNSNIRIEKEVDKDTNEILFTVVDKQAGFRLTASGGIGILTEL
jgi:hypothetical protein